MGKDLRMAIDRARLVLAKELVMTEESLVKFSLGGNLYFLVEKGSPAVKERILQIKQEAKELETAIEFLEKQ